MRSYKEGDLIVVEPFRRRKPFPVVRDLVTDRSAFDTIQQAGGFITARTGSAPEANSVPIGKDVADLAMDAAQCIGCGACVAACKNSSAMLFVAAKVSHLGLLPQGQPERDSRVLAMVSTMDGLGFGSCTNQYECSAACPKLISHDFIARMNRDYTKAVFRSAFKPKGGGQRGFVSRGPGGGWRDPVTFRGEPCYSCINMKSSLPIKAFLAAMAAIAFLPVGPAAASIAFTVIGVVAILMADYGREIEPVQAASTVVRFDFSSRKLDPGRPERPIDFGSHAPC